MSGNPHDKNIIKCPDCRATNPIATGQASAARQISRPILPKKEETHVIISDSPPKAVTVSSSHRRFASYRASQGPSTAGPRRPDGPYRANIHFYLSFFDIISGVPQYGSVRPLGMHNISLSLFLLPINTNCKIGAISARIPAIIINSIDEFIEQRLIPLLVEPRAGVAFELLADDRARLATRVSRSVPVFLSPDADLKQHVYDLLTGWFSSTSNEWTINVVIQRKEQSVAAEGHPTSPSSEADDDVKCERKGKAGRGGGRTGRKGRMGGKGGKGKAKMEYPGEDSEEGVFEPAEEDQPVGVGWVFEPAEEDQFTAEEGGEEEEEEVVVEEEEVEYPPDPETLFPGLGTSRKRSASNLSQSLRQQPRRSSRK
jgi:hypothetical protein